MAVNTVESLQLDLAEIAKLQGEATRQRIKTLLIVETEKIQREIKHLQESAEKKETEGASAAAHKPKSSSKVPITINTYGWDQSEKFMKLYVTLNGVQKIPKENITCNFNRTGFELNVSDLDNKDHRLLITRLSENILTDGSYIKVKTDMVLVMLKKEQSGKTWPYVVQKEDPAKKEKKEQQPIGAGDSQEGIMDLLKKMYDDGDDEMKRTISKAYSESQNKSGGMSGL